MPTTDVAAPGLDICPPPPRPGFTFTQGVLCGQLSFVIISVLFLKYFVFEDPAADRPTPKSRESTRKRSNRPRKSSVSLASPTPAILSALDYDLPTHAPESLDWLNVLMAQTLSAYRGLVAESTAGNGGGAKGLMEEMLNRKGPAEEGEDGEAAAPGLVGIDRIEVLDVVVGDKYPMLSNARVRPSGEDGGVRVELDVDFTDHVSLSISTCLLVNFPRPRFAVLPISLGLTLERFSGTLTLELPSPSALTTPAHPHAPGHVHHNPAVHLSLHPDFTLDLSTTSLLGSRAKLQDVPKVEQLILARIRGYIQDRVVWPGRVQVALPGVGTSHHHHARHPSHGHEASSGGHHVLPAGGSEEWEWIPSPTSDRTEGGGSGSTSSLLSDDQLSPDADSTTNYDDDDEPTSGNETPSIDLDADGGPSVILHPKIRAKGDTTPLDVGPSTSGPRLRRPSALLKQSTLPGLGAAARPPSPTESLPGHFAPPPPFSYFPTANGPAKPKPSAPPPSRPNGGRWVPRNPSQGGGGGLSAARLAAVAAAAADASPSGGGQRGEGMRYRMKGPGSVGMGVEVGSVGGGSRKGGRY